MLLEVQRGSSEKFKFSEYTFCIKFSQGSICVETEFGGNQVSAVTKYFLSALKLFVAGGVAAGQAFCLD